MAEQKDAFIILTPGFAASVEDSTCLPMQQQLVKTVAGLNPQMSIFVLSFQYPYHTSEYRWNGITVFPFNGRNRGGIKRLLLRNKVEAVLENLNKEYRIRGMLSFWLGECALVGKRFGNKNSIPHFCWLLGQDARAGNKYVRRIKPAETELVALSDSLQEEFNKNFGIRPFQIIPPGIEEPSSIQGNRDIDILGVGSLIPLKRYDIFIEVIAALKKNLPSVKAVIVGEGIERKRLGALLVRHELEQNLELVGSISHEKVLTLMERSKLLLHPSGYEGFSGVCMEALGRGAHVVSFCRAMKQDIDHWHIVDSQLNMTNIVLELLSQDLDHHPVIFGGIKTTVEKMMQLFHLNKA